MLITWLKKFFRLKPKLVIGIYSSIDDLPVFNFEKILNGFPQYILHDPTLISAANPELMVSASDNIMDEYFKELEIDLRDDDYFIFIQKAIEYRDKFIQGDKSAKNFVKYYELQIAELKRNTVKPDFVKNRMAIAKWFRQPIDTKTTTVKEFLSIHKLMMDEVNSKRKRSELVEDESN
jgi:hypothetical protein